MGRSLSPLMLRELENLDKDGDSRKSAMKALKSYVKDLDLKAIPIFLAQVSEIKQTGLSSGEHTISLYEVLARVHGPKIVPQIENIVNTIVQTLSRSEGAFALHQACSKVVPAIARYAIDPKTTEERKRHVIHSLCKPLSDSLLDSQENLSTGAALCLEALVVSANWRFASNQMVNEVCLRVVGALEKHSQTNTHMALVTALAKHNSQIVEAYARLLIQSGLKILDTEEDIQKRLSAIDMVSSLVRYLDSKSISSELELVINEMDKCQSDRMSYVSSAAFKVLQIAKRIYGDRCSTLESDVGSATNSNFGRRENTRMRNACNCGHLTASPESQTVDSFAGYDSSNSMNHGHQSLDCSRKSVDRRLWRRCENGVVDVSLRDGVCLDIARGNTISSEYDKIYHNHGDYFENFASFVQESAENEGNTPSSQSNSHIEVGDMKIFTTPRKLIQDVDDFDIGLSEKQRRSQMTGKFSLTAVSSSDSLSSTENVSNLAEIVQTNKPQLKKYGTSAKRLVCSLLVALFAVVVFLFVIGDQNDDYVIVPT